MAYKKIFIKSKGYDVYISPKSKIKGYKNIKVSNNVVIEDLVNLNIEGKLSMLDLDDNVWLGTNVTILDGVKINSGSIVAAGSVVTKDIPKNSIYSGVPAKFISHR